MYSLIIIDNLNKLRRYTKIYDELRKVCEEDECYYLGDR